MVKLFGYDVFTKGRPPASEDLGDVFSERGSIALDGIHKAYSPEVLYNPPFGYPRAINITLVRQLASNPYVYAIVKSLCDEVASAKWDVVIKEDAEDGEKTEELEKLRKDIKAFFNNPNKNKESFADVLRATTKDVLELDSGIWVKVFNAKKDMVQVFAKDGGSFLKNPDQYGYLGQRADYIEPLSIPDNIANGSPEWSGLQRHYELSFKNQAAYFQYGQSPTAFPVPFGRREVVYHSINPRANSIYGVSPVQLLADVITSLIYGAAYNLDYYMNGNMPEGFVSVIGADKEQLKAMKERLQAENRVKDPATGFWRKVGFKVPFSNHEVKFTPIQLDPKTMQIIEQQQWFTRVLWSCFGVTPDEMGFTDTSNRSVGEQQKKTYLRKAVRPLLAAYKYRIDNEMIPEWGEQAYKNLEWQWDEYDLDEELKKAQLQQAYIGMGVKTPKMVAEELGIDYSEVEEAQMNDPDFNMPGAPDEDGDFSYDSTAEESSAQQKALRGEVVAGHKYFRREGAAGNYRYFYSEEPRRRAQDEPVEWDVHGLLSTEMREAFKLARAEAEEEVRKDHSEAVLNKRPKRYVDAIDYMTSNWGELRARLKITDRYQVPALIYDTDQELFWTTLEKIPGPYDPRVRAMAYTLSEIRGAPAWFQTRLAERALLRYKDPKVATRMLAGIGVKVKISKKFGIESAADAKQRTIEAKKSAAHKEEHKGVSFTVGPGFKKASGAGPDTLSPLFKQALDTIPAKHAEILQKDGIRVAFVGRGEVKDLAESNNIGRAGGYYDSSKKLIVVFPPKEIPEWFRKKLASGEHTNPIKLNVKKEALVQAGYSEAIAEKVSSGEYGVEGVYKTLVHEMAHAVALASSTKAELQNEWNRATMTMRDREVRDRNAGIIRGGSDKRTEALQEFERQYATVYGSTSTKEDFAETYSTYALHKTVIDHALDKDEGWLSDGQKYRFRLMRSLWRE